MASLKWFRVVIATIVFVAITALFLDFTEKVPRIWYVLAHLQIVPAILFGGVGILAVWVLLTLLFGRVYCSTMCPLGILQDIIWKTRKIVRGKKARFRFRPAMTKTRLSIVVLFLIALPTLPIVVSLLDPYSNFGRMMASLFRPVALAGNNVLAWMLGETGSSTWYYRAISIDVAAATVSLLVLMLVGVLSLWFGRRYCNTICPVGTLLGWIAKLSRYKIRLKSDCISCGLCERSCKGECIDSKNKTVDASRCVACFNCLSTCRQGSLVYSSSRAILPVVESEPPCHATMQSVPVENPPRRRFLKFSISSLFLPSLLASTKIARSAPPDSSLPTGVSSVGYKMTNPILPPGASDLRHFQSNCTACFLCVSKCPTGILTPSTTELGLSGFLQPVVKFDHGFCNYECTICTEVCPTSALKRLETKEEKHLLQIGRVVFLKKNCVVHSQETNCGACAEHCPTGAVKMVPYGDPSEALTIPETDPDLCVGCGACEYICPVRPYRAIYVDGLVKHQKAKPAFDPNAKQKEVELDDFGF